MIHKNVTIQNTCVGPLFPHRKMTRNNEGLDKELSKINDGIVINEILSIPIPEM